MRWAFFGVRAAVLALPCETLLPVYTLSADCTVLRVDTAPVKEATARAEGVREGCWNLIWAIKNGTGYQAPAYLCVDFACMESFFAYAPQTETASGPFTLKAFRQAIAESGETRARHMGELGVGAVKLLSKVSLWELPGFRNATRDSFSSSLSILELFSLLHTLRAVEQYSVDVLQTVPTDAGPVLNPADIPF